jgi:hypothetical protein
MIYSAFRGALLISLGLLSLSTLAYAQSPKEESVLCYKSSIKEPLTFYGNPTDIFTLYDGRLRMAVLMNTFLRAIAT